MDLVNKHFADDHNSPTNLPSVTRTTTPMIMMIIITSGIGINRSVVYYHRGDDSTPEPSTTVVDGGPEAELGPEAGAFDEEVDAAADVCGGSGGGCGCGSW